MCSAINKIGDSSQIEARFEPKAYGLTKSETRVFEAIASGRKRKAVAALYHRSLHTINSQMESLLGKIGACTVEEAVALTVAEGKLTFHVIAKGARHLLLAGLIFSPLTNLLSEEPVEMRRARVYRISSVRVLRSEQIG